MRTFSASINREILRLAGPNILSNLSVPLLSTVDTLLMGSLSEAHIAAVGIGSMIFNFLYWNFGFLRMGTTGFTAQAFGRQDRQEVSNSLLRALLVAAAVSVLIWVLRVPLAESAYFLMAIPEQQQPMVADYFFVRILALPATLGLYALMGWYFGMQNALYPLWITIFINLLNMAISFWLVRDLGWEVKGVAYGTVAAQYAGLLLAATMIAYRYRSYFQKLYRETLWQAAAFKQFFSVNSDIFLRTVCLTLAYAFFFSRSSAAGLTILAANTLLYQFVIWMSYGIDGFAFAAESLVGKYKGADNEDQLRRVVTQTFVWGAGISFLLTLLYALFGKAILQLLTDEQQVVALALEYLPWAVALPLLSFASFLWDGVFVGLTASRAMRNSMFIALAFFMLFYFLLHTYGNHALWLSFTIYMGSRGLVQWYLYKRHENVLALR